MHIQRPFKIRGAGTYLPKQQLSSKEVEEKLELESGWIERYLGVENRHVASSETNSSMGATALKLALRDAAIAIHELDYLICAAATFDYILPSRSALIKHEFNLDDSVDFPCIDINSVCTSFISALDYAGRLLQDEKHKNIAIVSSEIASKGINPSDAHTYGLFGDGAAAVILTKSEKTAGLVQYSLKNYPKSAKSTIIKGGGNVHHPRDFPYNAALFSFQMEGLSLLRAAARQLPIFLDDFYADLPISLQETDWIVPHQASKNGLMMLEKLNGNRSENIINILSQTGNCIAASIPMALVHLMESGKAEKGDTCLLLGTAAGLSITAGLIVL